MYSDIFVGIITGFISGIASGFLVYRITKKREERYAVSQFWENYLFGILEKCEIYIPKELISKRTVIGDENTEWYKAIQNIIDISHPFGHEDIEFTEEQEQISNNVLIALDELNKWKKANKLN